jgi:hypothetical protein
MSEPVPCPVCGLLFADLWYHFGHDGACGERVLALARREAELMRPHGRH